MRHSMLQLSQIAVQATGRHGMVATSERSQGEFRSMLQARNVSAVVHIAQTQLHQLRQTTVKQHYKAIAQRRFLTPTVTGT